ncbi:vp91 [Peridroma alphabaculovirus]|uniref:Vp91 n=1 Tax=Peridroma alphabaculovirus TaxID=1346829 RepID=A0A068LKI4_9ABAC|nr:vp91 [Peridroma alphabaculovirus]AIE47797.1 vp91 [Peridroma alphabaculovirus]
MSTVPLLLVAIVLVIIFSILYLIIHSDFDEDEFDKKLRVLTEYSRRTNAEHPLPPLLRYVAEVDGHEFVLVTVQTDDLQTVERSRHDDRQLTFNFLEQEFEATLPAAERVRAHADEPSKFEVRGDDGWMDVDCPADEHFNADAMRCEPVPPCFERAPGAYGLTERLVDALVLNHRVPRANPNTDDVHPTMYLRCFEGGSHVVDECPAHHYFDAKLSQCVMHNDCESRPDGYILTVFPASLNINEYQVCRNGEAVVVACPAGKIFDRRLLMCVDAEPCAVHGAGYTFITDDIGPAQFYRCLSPTDAELVTCINRVFVDGGYECSGDARCTTFPDGTGTQARVFEDDVWSFDQGVLICDNYNVIKSIDCDTDNVLADKLFDQKFIVSLHWPREAYDAARVECVPFHFDMARVKFNLYGIDSVPNDLQLQFVTAFAGNVEDARDLPSSGTLRNKVTYARDVGAVGFNFVSGDAIDCYGDQLFDPFEGRRLNECADEELVRTVTFDRRQFFQPASLTVGSDDDYTQLCAHHLDQTSDFVIFDHFTTRILANIQRSDPCATILTQIHDQYTTITSKYTTIALKYTYESVKDDKYIERYGSNIPKNSITISDSDTGGVEPLFNLFEPYEVVAPLFDPWETRDLHDPPEETPAPPPPPAPPSLTLTDKLLDYSCFYSVPTYKLSGCNVDDEHVRNALKELRARPEVHPDCQSAAGLANVINAYAYLGDGLGCRSVYDDDVIKVIPQLGKTFTNIDTQSNDGVRYNTWLHTHNGTIMACPDHAVTDSFGCALEEDKLYYMEDLQ